MATEIRHRIPNAALGEALKSVIAGHFESRVHLVRWRRRLSVYSSSTTIENLKVELDDGQTLELVLKDLSPSSLLKTANEVRPHFLYDPVREIRTYQNILNPLGMGTPLCYGAAIDPELGRYLLFLERVNGPQLWQRGRSECWESAARWLAVLHSRMPCGSGATLDASLDHLPHHDRDYFNLWLSRAEEFLREREGEQDPVQRRRFARLINNYDRITNVLLQIPKTFIHGEFYPSNVILRRTQYGREICPVDWELAAMGPSLIDLAALTSGDWTTEQRMRMIVAYADALEPASRCSISRKDLIDGVIHCQLHLAVQLLGWASRWSPPQRHSQNWLGHALQLAAGLGI